MNEQAKIAAPDGLRECKLLIDGQWVDGEGAFEVPDKFTGKVVWRVAKAAKRQVNAAVAAAKKSFAENPLGAQERYKALMKAADFLEARRTEALSTYVAESGFTVSDAAGEFARTIQTLINSAEEAKRITGEIVPVETAPGQAHRMGYTIRLPLGVVCAITPFNAPFNTPAHKIAPALAAGNTVVMKPASATPRTGQMLCEVLIEGGFPAGHVNLVHGAGGTVGPALFANQDIRFFGFTGSTEVGKVIQSAAGLRRTSLELGSIASTILCEDADLDWAVPKCVGASFRKAGQVCTSVQRMYVHTDILDEFTSRLLDKVTNAQVGDPYDPKTMTGPMISEAEAVRAESWIREAIDAGAKALIGATREGAILQPTVLTDVTEEMRVMREEIFAPMINIIPFSDIDAAIDSVNNTEYGLATGIFTRDINRAIRASRRLHVGGVHINETCSSRVDLMPYGGAKESGDGREGPLYAIREMTEDRMITISLI